MATEAGLFGKYKQCEFCRRPLPNDYEDVLCPRCKDNKLLHDVKEFIRANQVNEYEVADHFGIPLKQVKAWIREGRIEYNTTSESGTISGMHCQHCGAPVTFGSLCPKCLKLLNGGRATAAANNTANSKMHYLDNEDQTS